MFLVITLVLFNIFSLCFLFFILQEISEQFITEFETLQIFKGVKKWTKVTHVLGILASLDSCQTQKPVGFVFLPITLDPLDIYSISFLFFILQDISKQIMMGFETLQIFKGTKNWTKLTNVLGILAHLDTSPRKFCGNMP